MSFLAGHGAFIAAAYGLSALVLAGLTLWVITDGARQRRTLADLEAKGIRRRSRAGRE
jgi:heme exporter protein D